jgi:prophage regulatory protein
MGIEAKFPPSENKISGDQPVRNDRFIRLPEVMYQTGFSRSSIYRLVELGEFPPGCKIGKRASAWLQSAISAWVQQRAAKQVRS